MSAPENTLLLPCAATGCPYPHLNGAPWCRAHARVYLPTTRARALEMVDLVRTAAAKRHSALARPSNPVLRSALEEDALLLEDCAKPLHTTARTLYQRERRARLRSRAATERRAAGQLERDRVELEQLRVKLAAAAPPPLEGHYLDL